MMTLVLIDEPQGIYYGGQVAGPIMKEVLENALPYLNVKRIYNQDELDLEEVKEIEVPNFLNMKLSEAKKKLNMMKLNYEIVGSGQIIYEQFPMAGEKINLNSKIILYLGN